MFRVRDTFWLSRFLFDRMVVYRVCFDNVDKLMLLVFFESLFSPFAYFFIIPHD